MQPSVIACDLGTGGLKAAVFDATGRTLAERLVSYETYYPAPSRHEQRPQDWWGAIAACLPDLLASTGVERSSVRAIVLSGHSLGCIPVAADGTLLQTSTPIWSDGRAEAEAADFFRRFDETAWYRITGNGFPAPLYPLFKILWLRRWQPEILSRARWILGTKDYINFRLTGRIATDHSYASGSGLYDLRARRYSEPILDAAGIDPGLFPAPVESTSIIGEVLADVAASLDLPPGVRVVAGGVDNSCMALGSGTYREGAIFCAMGSSSWLTISSGRPLLEDNVRPYVFTHVVPDLYISATSIFSSGTSLAWVRNMLLPDIAAAAEADGADGYEALMKLADTAPRGANGLVFVPTLGGGTSFEGGPSVRGAFVGLDLKHTRADIIRATLEGVALGLRAALDELRRMTAVRDEMIVVGGGARSPVWRRIFADVFDCAIVKTNVDQQAATLGAAALALVGVGLWPDFEGVEALLAAEPPDRPDPAAKPVYEFALAAYRKAATQQREAADLLSKLRSLSQ